MCGILGLLRFDGAPVERPLLEKMAARLAHRGPDGHGFHQDGGLGLGHTRLSIIDVAGGAQPLSNEDGTVWVSFNGEIYNHRDLRRDLEPRHRFRTRSDTEVLVHLYEERGEAMLDALQGMYAFALWDAKEGRLLLARDRLGKKPLFFARSAQQLAFASEIGALLCALPERPGPDPEALNEVLALRYAAGARSGWAGIERLRPGELLTWHRGAVELKRFWLPPAAAPVELAEADALRELRAGLDAAVGKRLESEVPLGLLLSGGLDSTAVLESMSRQMSAPVRTFTVTFTRERESEGAFARAAALHFRSEHQEIPLHEDALSRAVQRVLAGLDEPFADPSFLPTALVCAEAKAWVTVCLTGDGGDELLGGYKRYAEVLRASERRTPAPVAAFYRALLPRLPAGRLKAWKLRRALTAAVSTPEERYVARLVSAEAALREELLGPRAEGVDVLAPERDLLAGLSGPGPLQGRMLALDQREYLPGLILTKADRASMQSGLELRSPLLDTELVEWAARLSERHRSKKRLLRRALEGRVPPLLLERGKRGFGTPLGRWFRQDLAPLVDELLLGSELARDGWLDGQGIARVVRSHRARARNYGEVLWTLLALETWYRTWVRASAPSPAYSG